LNFGKFLRLSFSSEKKLMTDQNDWINVLILGRPGKGNPAPDLTDSIILASFKGDKALFISIPRDLYVKIPKNGNYAKINSLISLGYDQSIFKETIELITDRSIHYSILVDLELLKKITDYLEGVNVMVREDINDSLFPGPNHSYDPFRIKKGWRHLDGETLLKYVRTRYGSEGDFGRMKRQQQVLASIKTKIGNLNSFQNFNFILSLYNKFQEHISTDLTIAEIKSLWQKTKKLDISSSGAFTLSLKEPKLLKEAYIPTNQGRMFILLPEDGLGNYTKIQNYVNQIYESY
jgi:LCP family protein required for cell wall assembly